jgi:hypothetical protein
MRFFPWAGVANGKWHMKSHYPTQAKTRLEWGTQHPAFVAGVTKTSANHTRSSGSRSECEAPALRPSMAET